MPQTNDNSSSRIWIDEYVYLLGAFVYNTKIREVMQESELVKKALRIFYSFHYLQQQVIFSKDLTDKIYKLNRRLNL